MKLALVSAAAKLATASAAPAAIATDPAADTVASFAATLDRSRESLADAPASADGDAAAPASGRKSSRSALRSCDDSARPDTLALLLAGAAMAAHANQPARTAPVANAFAESPLPIARAGPNATGHAAPKSTNLQEPLGHELLAASGRPGRARPAAGMEGAGNCAAAPPAALASADAAGAAKPAPTPRPPPDTLAASVDLVALAGRAGVQAREAGSAGPSHVLSSAVAADSASALAASAEADTAALKTSAGPRGGGTPNSHGLSTAVAAHPASAPPAAADAAAAALTSSTGPRGGGAPKPPALSSAVVADAAPALPAAADASAAALRTSLGARVGRSSNSHTLSFAVSANGASAPPAAGSAAAAGVIPSADPGVGASNSRALSPAVAGDSASALPAAAEAASAALATSAGTRGGRFPNSHALSSDAAADAASPLPAAADAVSASLMTPGAGAARNERQPGGDDGAHKILSATLAAAPSATSVAPIRPADAQGSVAPPVGSGEWAPAIAQQIARLAPGRSQIELDLHPAELGPLTVKLTVGAAQAQVMFLSEHAAVRQALEAALPQLRTTLADSGISLGEASIGGGAGGQASAQQDRRRESPTPRDTPPRDARTAAADPLAPVRAGSAPGVDAFA